MAGVTPESLQMICAAGEGFGVGIQEQRGDMELFTAPLPVLGPCVMESHRAWLLWVFLASWDFFQQPCKELNGRRCFLLTGAGSLKGS